MRDEAENLADPTAEGSEAQSDDWLKLRLIRKVRETPLISSLYFENALDAPLPEFKAGQYLTLAIPREGDRPLLRTYTVSSSPAERDSYRITVKREPAPEDQPEAMPGIGSHFLHDQISEGDVIECLPPRGRFVLDDSDRPIVLLSGGVGITPMLAMLAEQAHGQSARPIWFVHACQGAAHRVLSDEVRTLAEMHGLTHALSVLETAEQQDQPDHLGRVDMAFLKKHLPFDDYSFYLCGPPGFMAALYQGLTSLNVGEDRIFYEFFGPATVLKPQVPSEADTPAKAEPDPNALTVEFVESGQTASFESKFETLLGMAKASGIDAMHSCEEGICGTCRCKLLEGEVEYVSEPIAYLEDGEILTCICKPKTDVKLYL